MGRLKIKPEKDGLHVSIGFLQHLIPWEQVDEAVERVLPAKWRALAALALRTLEAYAYPPAGAPGVPNSSVPGMTDQPPPLPTHSQAADWHETRARAHRIAAQREENTPGPPGVPDSKPVDQVDEFFKAGERAPAGGA